jgi:hypothetical protein
VRFQALENKADFSDAWFQQAFMDISGSSQGAHFEVYTLHSPLNAIQQR